MKQWNELTDKEKIALIRFYPDEDFKDEDWSIRCEAYRVFGYTEEAFKDEDVDIRLEAYRALGYTEEALKDEYWLIREEARIYIEHLKQREEKVTIELTQEQLAKVKELLK